MFVSSSHFHPAVNKFCTQKIILVYITLPLLFFLCDTFLSYLVRKTGVAEFKAELFFFINICGDSNKIFRSSQF
jgi:hypothetical protein